MVNEIPDDLFKRMVLANQYRMLALLDRGGRGDWETAAEMVEDGWPVDGLPGVTALREASGDPLTREDQEFVLDLFEIHAALQDAVKAGMRPADGKGVAFPGYDGHTDCKLIGYARHLVGNERRFAYVEAWEPGSFDSHMPVMEMYRRLRAAWQAMGRPLALSEEQFDALIAARKRPARETA